MLIKYKDYCKYTNSDMECRLLGLSLAMNDISPFFILSFGLYGNYRDVMEGGGGDWTPSKGKLMSKLLS